MNSALIRIAQNILAESTLVESKTDIYCSGVTPDAFRWESRETYQWRDAFAAFAFFGPPPGALVYIKNIDGNNNSPATHWTLFDAISDMRKKINDEKLKKLKIRVCKKLTLDDIDYAIKTQKIANEFDINAPRKHTKAGRLWKNVNSKKLGKKVNIVIFWCKEKDIKSADLATIKKEFDLPDMIWAATDSMRFNLYNKAETKVVKGDTMELHSKLFPDLTHDEILAILIKAHTKTDKLSPLEDKVVREFRGTADMDRIIKQVTGGYDTPAEFNYRSRMSEGEEAAV